MALEGVFWVQALNEAQGGWPPKMRAVPPTPNQRDMSNQIVPSARQGPNAA